MSRGAEPLGGEAARRRKRASRGYMLPLPVWNTGCLWRICTSKSKIFSGVFMLTLQVSTDNLYDPVVRFYEALFDGEKTVSLRLTVNEGMNPGLLSDFLSLVEDG